MTGDQPFNAAIGFHYPWRVLSTLRATTHRIANNLCVLMSERHHQPVVVFPQTWKVHSHLSRHLQLHVMDGGSLPSEHAAG
jgi:hypothetical protein